MHTQILLAKLVTMALGLLIAGQAYRGYRRNESRSMLFVAIGFVFISLGALLEGILMDLSGFSLHDAGVVATGLVAVGMLSVLYALYVPTVDSQ